MKFINSFDILKSDLKKSTTTRPFTIQGDANAVFDLKITKITGLIVIFGSLILTILIYLIGRGLN